MTTTTIQSGTIVNQKKHNPEETREREERKKRQQERDKEIEEILRKQGKKLTSYIRQNPGKVILFATAAGILAGYLLRKR